MESRRILFLFAAVFAMVAMLVSCTARQQTPIAWPTTPNPPIGTTMIEVTGDKGEKLQVILNPETGLCEAIIFNGEIKASCNDPKFSTSLANTFFCIPPEYADEEANAVINQDGEKKMFCGSTTFLTNGVDIQIKSKRDPDAGNRKCKNVGGHVICYPPLQ